MVLLFASVIAIPFCWKLISDISCLSLNDSIYKECFYMIWTALLGLQNSHASHQMFFYHGL